MRGQDGNELILKAHAVILGCALGAFRPVERFARSLMRAHCRYRFRTTQCYDVGTALSDLGTGRCNILLRTLPTCRRINSLCTFHSRSVRNRSGKLIA